jgi:hypothetical protein
MSKTTPKEKAPAGRLRRRSALAIRDQAKLRRALAGTVALADAHGYSTRLQTCMGLTRDDSPSRVL